MRSLLITATLVAVAGTAMASPAGVGVSRSLAIERAERLTNLRYQLAFTVKEHQASVSGTEALLFESSSAGDLPIDYRDGTIQSATLNGHSIPKELRYGHLNLPVVAGQNTLTVAFTSNAAPAGKAITRYDDKDDGSEYFYSLFVPMDASMAFPCFDQPDLKAKFALTIEHPANWSVIGNTHAVAITGTHTKFAETRPISTYLFAFAAGPFAALRSQNPSEPVIFVRKSQLARAEPEAAEVQQMAARGIAYFSEYFSQPFPFPKYDLVLIPGFPFGGMDMPVRPSSTKTPCSFAPPRQPATTFTATSCFSTRPAINGSAISLPCAGSMTSGSKKASLNTWPTRPWRNWRPSRMRGSTSMRTSSLRHMASMRPRAPRQFSRTFPT